VQHKRFCRKNRLHSISMFFRISFLMCQFFSYCSFMHRTPYSSQSIGLELARACVCVSTRRQMSQLTALNQFEYVYEVDWKRQRQNKNKIYISSEVIDICSTTRLIHKRSGTCALFSSEITSNRKQNNKSLWPTTRQQRKRFLFLSRIERER
jgi:hypothetical protein